VTLGGGEETGRRYGAILSPGGDASVEGRLTKWRSAVDDVDSQPFGHGAGTAGRTQVRFGRFQTIGGLDIDNSYLKVAYEQGLVVLLLWVAGALLLLVALAMRATSAADPARAALGIGACATLVSMLVLFFIGDYIEGLPALAGWILVGLGLGQFTRTAAA
jgi:O-antigen ligase